ncbi:hypothetical protein CC80DRAFT_537670 [Byssothecium circinans]|uniref:Uncharacterized protein n=1 Tax=Byssothecium circinans TaxID=147558 RepID=A0A6A5TM49_9PLEO|nr:hypothetical protein CC80DRAFT_537670 [Byssothecium circinans]
MSTGRSNAMDAIPHASLLTYFRCPRPRQSRRMSRHYQRPPPPPPNSATCASRPLLSRIPEAESETSDTDVGEESRLELWREREMPKYQENESDSDEDMDVVEKEDTKGCSWGISGILSLMSVVDGAMYASAPQEMQFCLETRNRDAPVSRVWRYIAPLSHEDCATQIATLTAGPTDAWKLHSDDKILFGVDTEVADKEDEPTMDKFIGTGPEMPVEMKKLKLGDDLAEEGDLHRWREAKVESGYREHMREVV